MLELSSSGSVRGVPSNGHPYRDPGPVAAVLQAVLKLLQISLRLSREPFDALAIHPAAPWLRATFHHAASRVVGRTTLSIRLYHLPPLTPLPSARHHALGPDRCFGPPPLPAAAGFCPLRSLFRHSRGGLLLHSRPRTSNFLPSFPRSGFAAAPLHGPRPYRGIMKALTPAALHPTGRSLRLLRFAVPAFRPQPRKLPAGRFASRLSAAGCFQTSPPMSRLATALRRIRFVILRTPGSPPVAPHPRLAATQLPSIAEPATGSGADLHRADKAPSRTLSHRRRPVSICRNGSRPSTG